MPEAGERGRGVIPGRIAWRTGFSLAWCVLLASTVAASILLGGASTTRGVFLAGVAAGEFVRAVFHPIERLRNAVAEGTDGPLPEAKGPLAPLTEAISARLERSVATLREA